MSDDIVARLRAACETSGKPTGRHMIEGQRALAKVFAQSADEDARNIADVALCMATCIENEARLFDALRDVSIEAADENERLRAELAAERENNKSLNKHLTRARGNAQTMKAERDALRAQRNEAMAAVSRAVDMKIEAEAERDAAIARAKKAEGLLLDAYNTWGEWPQETLARIANFLNKGGTDE